MCIYLYIIYMYVYMNSGGKAGEWWGRGGRDGEEESILNFQVPGAEGPTPGKRSYPKAAQNL